MGDVTAAACQHYFRYLYPLEPVVNGAWFGAGERDHQLSGWRCETAEAFYTRRRATSRLHLPTHLVAGGHLRTVHVVPDHEFVVDLDLNDWDTYRRADLRAHLFADCVCHGERRACAACWALAECSVDVLRAFLGDMYGLGEPLVVFSGGKGVHVWWRSSSSSSSSILDADQRAALAEEFARWRTGARLDELVQQRARNPRIRAFVRRAYETWMNRIVGGRRQTFASGTRAQCHWLAQFLPTDAARQALIQEGWPRASTSLGRWQAFVHAACQAGQPLLPLRVALEVVLPLPDVALYQRGHLIKLPFSLHHGPDARVALPLDPATLATCDPHQMPTAVALMRGETEAMRLFRQANATAQQWMMAVNK